jgi:hypothetical protein
MLENGGIDRKPAPAVASVDQAMQMLLQVGEAGGTLTPNANPYAKNGYEYPVSGLDERYLGSLADHGYLDERFFDRVSLCPKCLSHHLNLREVCPTCRRPNLSDEIMLHHFRCGYVGRIAEYTTTNGDRVCPKCSRRLSHIGTEYDRLGKMFRCNECGLSFQDPPVDALCLSCGTHTPAEDLPTADIFSYTLSSRGVAALQRGNVLEASWGSSLIGESPIFGPKVICTLLAHEAKRSEYFKIPFCVLMLDVSSGVDTTSEEERTFHLVSSLRSRLREVDLIGQLSASRFVVALPQMDNKQAERVRQVLLSEPGMDARLAISLVEIRGPQDIQSVLVSRCGLDGE